MAGIEAKTRQAEDAVVRAKGKYDEALSELEELMKEQEHIQDLALVALFRKIGKSFDAVRRYLNDSSRL